MLVMKYDGALAGLLFFETQGVASTVRFWVVAEKFRARRVGSALMQAIENSSDSPAHAVAELIITLRQQPPSTNQQQ